MPPVMAAAGKMESLLGWPGVHACGCWTGINATHATCRAEAGAEQARLEGMHGRGVMTEGYFDGCTVLAEHSTNPTDKEQTISTIYSCCTTVY